MKLKKSGDLSNSKPSGGRSLKFDVPVPKPWYRQFWAWFILAPLILVVIVSSITVTIAVRHADDRVIDKYYKEGRMINMRHDEDQLARQLDVSAELHFDRAVDELTLKLSGLDEAWPDRLVLKLGHPARAERDRRVVLTRIAANQYHADLPASQSLEYRWYLRLLPEISDAEVPLWRLRGEINFAGSERVVLAPVLLVRKDP